MPFNSSILHGTPWFIRGCNHGCRLILCQFLGVRVRGVSVSLKAPRRPRIHRPVCGLFDMHQALMLAAVQTEKASYENSQEASITVSVVDVAGPVGGAAVRLEVTNAEGDRLGGEAVTGDDGAASLTYSIDTARDGAGTYAVDAAVSKAGYDSARSSTTFQVTGEVTGEATGRSDS